MLPIVIVDDVEDDLLLAERILRQCKILNPIKVLKSGKDCISYFEGGSGFEQRVLPCLLFLDLIMPMHGVEVLKYLRKHNLADDSLVVMLSGLQDIKAIHQGYQLGARTFLVKPITVEDVVQLLSSLPGLRVDKKPEGHVLSLDSANRRSEAVRDPRSGDTSILSPSNEGLYRSN
jgi:CheY-like chemotaxis protein